MAVGGLAVILIIGGCYYTGPCINGSGSVISEPRAIVDFTGVANTGSFDVYVSEAENFSVEVVAQEKTDQEHIAKQDQRRDDANPGPGEGHADKAKDD